MIHLYRYSAPPSVAIRCDVPECAEFIIWPLSWQPQVDSMRRFALMCGWTQPLQGKDMCQDHTLELEKAVKADVDTESTESN